MDAPTTQRSITLSFAADPVLLRVVRLATSSLATDADFTISEIDDLTLAVDELTAALIDVATADVQVTIRTGDGSVTVEASSPGATGMRLNELATMIVERTTDQHALAETGGGYTMTKTRRRDGA